MRRVLRKVAVPVGGTAWVGSVGCLCGWAIAAAGGLPGGVAVARADPGSPVALRATVYAPDGSSSLDAMTVSDLGNCPAYSGPQEIVEHTRDGRSVTVDLPSAQPGTSEGTWNLGSLLGCLARPIPLADVQSVVVLDASGAPEGSSGSLLVPGSGDVGSPSDFADPREVPTLSDLGSTLEYNRPARAASDPDYPDQTSEPVGTPVAIEVYEGSAPLAVSITAPGAAAATVASGATVRFAATVSGGHGGGGDGYVWNFGGGGDPASSTAPAPSARFATPGVYRVTLQVTDGAGDVGQATPVEVTVTGAARTGTTSTSAGSATASVRARTSGRPAPSGHGRGSSGPTRGRGSGGGSTAPPRPRTGGAVGRAVQGRPGPVGSAPPSAAAPRPVLHRTSPVRSPRRPADSGDALTHLSGTPVSGQVIDRPQLDTAVPARLGSLAPARRLEAGLGPAGGGSGWSLPVGGLAAAGLLALGAATELRRRPGRL